MFHPTIKSKDHEDISILLQLDNHPYNYICDCGDASDLTVKECQQTAAIFISHTHIDHFINFDFILRHQVGMQKRIVICGPKGITQQVQSKIQGYLWNLVEEGAIVYEVREILGPTTYCVSEIAAPDWNRKALTVHSKEKIFKNDLFEVDYVILDHKTPSIAYLFKEKDTLKIDLKDSGLQGGPWVRDLKNAFLTNQPHTAISLSEKQVKAAELYPLLSIKKGKSLGVILDHAASKENHDKIKSLFFHCDKVFIESFYMAQEKALAEQHFHSYSTASAAIMTACRVGEAIPVHFSRRYSSEEIALLKSEFYETFRV